MRGERGAGDGVARGESRVAGRARLFRFPESVLKVAGRLPGLRVLRKLTSSLYVDSAPIRRDLGWTPLFTMEEGFRRTLVR
jgi:nucleoside-diphosphate-sugar epimerase